MAHLPAPDHIQCAKCLKILPAHRFKTYMSHLRSLRLGYAGMVRMQVTSKYCAPCRPRKKKPKVMHPKQIRNLLGVGLLQPIVAEKLTREYDARKINVRLATNAKLAERYRRRLWQTLITDLDKELLALRNQLAYRRREAVNEAKHRRGRPPYSRKAAADAVQQYAMTYIDALSAVRAKLVVGRDERLNPGRPYHEVWQQYLRVDERAKIWAAFAAIPEAIRVNMRTPRCDVPPAPPVPLRGVARAEVRLKDAKK